MTTLAELLVSAARRLSRSPSPRLDAEILMMRLLRKERAWLYAHPEFSVPVELAAAYDTLIDARERGMPVAYLTGEREFFSRIFKVTPDTLIPRPDTERLVDAALQMKLPERARVLDLGTGTGALAITLALECPEWDVTATDASDAALAVARENAARLGACVRFSGGDWFAAVAATDRFDLIVSNPPYIALDDTHLGEGDVRFEPRAALVASEQGLADIAHITGNARSFLNDGGWLLVEHGWQQGDAVRALAQALGYAPVKTLDDLSGNPRALLAGWRQPDDPEQAHHA
jgi:release factor glutamine methyltransferase